MNSEECVLRKIAETLTEILAKKGEPIFYKGDIGKKMYIILDGAVRVHDKDYTFATLTNGQVFGEYALLDTEERSASVTAIQDTKLLVLDQKLFYSIMVNHVNILQGILKVLVGRARTNNRLQEELAREKAFVIQKNEEILAQQEKIEAINKLLSEQNHLIKSSIEYARNIQFSLLPELSEFKRILPHSFILYLPKDVVSGDYYWFYEDKETHRFLVVCADCTGHGVPGAMMSFLGTTYLKQIVEFEGVRESDEILERLNKEIFLALKQGNQFSKDGMDLCLVWIDKSNKTIEFAGAKGLMYAIAPNQVEGVTYQGDKLSIGGENAKKCFTRQIFQYEEGTCFYMFTDGYRDQFSGTTNRKFMVKRQRELLLSIKNLPFEEQYQKVLQTHLEWKGNEPQTDDILMIGFQL
jgi:serine phosphatase RsbU (regulator of sigma subunit)